MSKIDILEKIANIAEKIIYECQSLQPDQFNPETYKVPSEHIDALVFALRELEDAESDGTNE